MSDEFNDKGIGSLAGLFKQAQELQGRFKRMQEEAGEKTVEASAGGGMVRVVVDGLMRVRKLEIDPALIAANDQTMLQDLIVAAINDGLRRAKELVTNEIGKLSPFANLKIPGMGGD
jgi:DNA-binding YbaB/EbfC family protein